MSSSTILLSEVHARWAYSEITDGALSHGYNSIEGIDELRNKRRDGRQFSELSEADRYKLALACWSARPNLMVFCAGIDRFELVELTKADLRVVLVPPMVSPELDKLILFETFVNMPAPASPKDARNISGNHLSYLRPTEPLTIGRFHQYRVLIDGFHRAVGFWRFGQPTATLEAFVPEK